MAEGVEVKITPAVLKVPAGGTAEAAVSIRNASTSVDQLTLSLNGLDTAWYQLPVSSVALFPNDQDNLKILFTVPKTVKAGTYPVQVFVASQDNKARSAAATINLEVEALPEIEFSLNPPRVTGRKGSYQVLLRNPTSRELAIQLAVNDGRSGLRYRLQPDALKVPAGGRAEASLAVKLSWSTFFGGKREFEFQVTADSAEEDRSITGYLVRVPWYKALPQLPEIRLPWMAKPPVIRVFNVTTDDHREFKLAWAVSKSKDVRLNGEKVAVSGEKLVAPNEPMTFTLTAVNKYGSPAKSIDILPVPKPVERVSSKLKAALSPLQLRVTAGEVPALATLQVQNASSAVDKFSVEVDGIDASWYTRSAATLVLMPETSGQVQITFLPPKKKGVKAGIYPFAVTLRSQAEPSEAASVVGQLEIAPALDFKLGVKPNRLTVGRKGAFRINLANNSVSNANIALEATDLDEGLRFQFKENNISLRAWQTLEVPLVVRPKRGSFIGEKKRYDITVTASAGDNKTQTAGCEFNHHPTLASWKPILRLIRAIIVLGLVVIAIFFIIRAGGGWNTLTSSPQTWVEQLIETVQGWFSR